MDTDSDHSSTEPPDHDQRQRRHRLLAAYATGLALLATTVVVGAASHATLRSTQTSLTSVQAELRRATAHLAATRAELSTVTSQSGSARSSLATESAQLSADQTELASAEVNVFAKGVSISELDACLSSVERALNQISLGDQSGAATTISGASASCRAAEPAGP